MLEAVHLTGTGLKDMDKIVHSKKTERVKMEKENKQG